MMNKSCYYYENNNIPYCIIKKENLTECPDKCKWFELVTAFPLFLNHMDKLYSNASKIEPIEGYEDIVMHSTSLYFVNKNADNKENIVTVDEFVEIVKLQYGSKTPNIRLISCLAGVLSNGVAQQMADKLHVKVLAAQGVVAVDVEGEVSVLDPVTSETIDNEKAWKCFCPKESE